MDSPHASAFPRHDAAAAEALRARPLSDAGIVAALAGASHAASWQKPHGQVRAPKGSLSNALMLALSATQACPRGVARGMQPHEGSVQMARGAG